VSPSWWRIAISCREEDTDAVAAALVQSTGQGVEEPIGGSLLTVAMSEADAKRIVAELSAIFRDLEGVVTRLEPVDWSIRSSLMW